MICYVLMKCQIKNIYAELNIITVFPSDSNSISNGMSGYSLSVVQAALEHILTLSPTKNLNILTSGITLSRIDSVSSEFSLKLSPSLSSLPSRRNSIESVINMKSSAISLDFSDDVLFSLFQITQDDILANYSCHFPALLKKGQLLLTPHVSLTFLKLFLFIF